MTPHESNNVSVVLKYFHDGCNSGDLDVLLSILYDDSGDTQLTGFPYLERDYLGAAQ